MVLETKIKERRKSTLEDYFLLQTNIPVISAFPIRTIIVPKSIFFLAEVFEVNIREDEEPLLLALNLNLASAYDESLFSKFEERMRDFYDFLTTFDNPVISYNIIYGSYFDLELHKKASEKEEYVSELNAAEFLKTIFSNYFSNEGLNEYSIAYFNNFKNPSLFYSFSYNPKEKKPKILVLDDGLKEQQKRKNSFITNGFLAA